MMIRAHRMSHAVLCRGRGKLHRNTRHSATISNMFSLASMSFSILYSAGRYFAIFSIADRAIAFAQNIHALRHHNFGIVNSVKPLISRIFSRYSRHESRINNRQYRGKPQVAEPNSFVSFRFEITPNPSISNRYRKWLQSQQSEVLSA